MWFEALTSLGSVMPDILGEEAKPSLLGDVGN
jgi:hypothetical protein